MLLVLRLLWLGKCSASSSFFLSLSHLSFFRFSVVAYTEVTRRQAAANQLLPTVRK